MHASWGIAFWRIMRGEILRKSVLVSFTKDSWFLPGHLRAPNFWNIGARCKVAALNAAAPEQTKPGERSGRFFKHPDPRNTSAVLELLLQSLQTWSPGSALIEGTRSVACQRSRVQQSRRKLSARSYCGPGAPGTAWLRPPKTGHDMRESQCF